MTARKTAVTVASAAALALAVPAIKKSEGYWPTVKIDWVGTGHPATGGYGETENVKLGETHTEKYWADRLQQRISTEYDAAIGACIHVWVPDSVRAASDSAAYNAGSAAFCRSPMVAKMNAGDFRGACNAFAGWYVRASGRVVQGLINRRASERKLCLSGVDQKMPETSMSPAKDDNGKPWPKGDSAKECAWWQKCK